VPGHEFADGALIATLWLLLCDGKEGPALELAGLFRYPRGMSCDCEQQIAELRAEVDALRDAFMQILDERVDKFLETIVRDLSKHVDTIEAKQQMLLWRVDERVERVFARLEAAMQSAPLQAKGSRQNVTDRNERGGPSAPRSR
jgi:chorismate mutase